MEKDFLEQSKELVDLLEGLSEEEKQKQINIFTLKLFMDLHSKVEAIYNKVCKK